LLVVAVVQASHLVFASERNPAVVVLPQAEEIKDSTDGKAMTTTYLEPRAGPSSARIRMRRRRASWEKRSSSSG
jgi:hypothetical protein